MRCCLCDISIAPASTLISFVWRMHSITGILTAFFAGSQAEIKMVTILTTAAPPTARADTSISRVTPLKRIVPKLLETARRIRWIAPSPARIPIGIPTAPIHNPSKRTELRSCFAVAPTEASTPISRIRSFSEILNEL